jgi:hypothetical protein
MRPFYNDAAFWTTAVAAVAAVLGGIFSEAEVELFVSAAAIVITYLVQKGIVEKASIAASMTYMDGYRDAVEVMNRRAAKDATD